MSELMNIRDFIAYVEQNCEQRFTVVEHQPYFEVIDNEGKSKQLEGLLVKSEQEARYFAAIMNGSCRGAASRELISALRHHSEEFSAGWLTHPIALAANKVRVRTKAALAKVEAAPSNPA